MQQYFATHLSDDMNIPRVFSDIPSSPLNVTLLHHVISASLHSFCLYSGTWRFIKVFLWPVQCYSKTDMQWNHLAPLSSHWKSASDSLLSRPLNAIKSSQAISHVNFYLKNMELDISSVSIIEVQRPWWWRRMIYLKLQLLTQQWHGWSPEKIFVNWNNNFWTPCLIRRALRNTSLYYQALSLT
jgi:hypothetical protein